MKIAVLYGGPSNEHEVSVQSGKNVLKNIDTTLFEAHEVFINKKGEFIIGDKSYEATHALDELKSRGVEVVFPVLHGSFGEDGTLQQMMEEKEIMFVGSNSETSRTVIDKNKTNYVYESQSLMIPRTQVITQQSRISFSFPIIVKPIAEGSSRGLVIIQNQENFENKKEEIFAEHKVLLAQEYIVGREFTCGVIEMEGTPLVLPITEIILTNSRLFDYKTKYSANECEEITPAQIDNSLKERIQEIALKAHIALGCKGISRTDMILSNNELFVLETNTLPGMTEFSFIPKQAKIFGLEMKDLLTTLIYSANNK